MDVRSFVRGLPKAELHIHLEGSLEPEMLIRLAARNCVAIPFRSVEEVRSAYRFDDLQDFLDIYYQGMNVLRTEEDFYDLTMAYLERAAADGTVHVEVFYDPQAHTGRGIPFSTVTDGVLTGLADGRDRFGISSLLIMCILRHLPEEDGFDTLRQAERYIADGRISGLGLDSTERGNPPGKFRHLFATARRAGLKLVAHAGEEGPAGYVAEAVDQLRIDRIDHGNRALEDPGAGPPAGETGYSPYRLPSLQSASSWCRYARTASAETHAGCGSQGDRQLGRPCLFWRLPAGQLRCRCWGTGAQRTGTRDIGTQLCRGLVPGWAGQGGDIAADRLHGIGLRMSASRVGVRSHSSAMMQSTPGVLKEPSNSHYRISGTLQGLCPASRSIRLFEYVRPRASERTVEVRLTAIKRILDTFTPNECRNYFATAEYDPDR